MMLAAAMMASAAVMPGSEHGLAVRAYAANVSNQNSQNISGGGTEDSSDVNDISKGDAKSDDVDTSKSADKQDADNSNGDGIYNFKDNKTSGTVTVT